MIRYAAVIFSVMAAGLLAPYAIQSSAAQNQPKPYVIPSYVGVSSCTAQGTPPCSISCPAGRAAICNNGGMVPGQCLCR